MKIRDIENKQIRERAIELAISSEARDWRRSNSLKIEPKYAEDFLLGYAFPWGNSKEGYGYWENVYRKANMIENSSSDPNIGEIMCQKTPTEDKSNESGHILPAHYDNEHGSLYKIAKQRGWDPYQFDAIKRIDRMYKKGELERDIEKTKTVLDMAKAKL